MGQGRERRQARRQRRRDRRKYGDPDTEMIDMGQVQDHIGGMMNQGSLQTVPDAMLANQQWGGERLGAMDAGSGGFTQNPQGFDFRSPGVAEQLWNQHQGRWMERGSPNQQQFQNVTSQYQAPGASENYWGQMSGQAATPAYSEMLAQGPGLDPYYDRQREQALGALNDQLAARGAFGSTAGMGMINDALVGLGAEQANREAQYAAQVAGQADQARMNRLMGFGDLASDAQQGQLGRLDAAAQALMSGDASEIARLNAMMNAAAQAQGLRRQRGQDYFSNLQSSTFPMMGIIGQGLQGIIGQDQQMMDSSQAALMGMFAEALNQDYKNQEAHRADIGMIADLYKTFAGGAGAAGGGA